MRVRFAGILSNQAVLGAFLKTVHGSKKVGRDGERAAALSPMRFLRWEFIFAFPNLFLPREREGVFTVGIADSNLSPLARKQKSIETGCITKAPD